MVLRLDQPTDKNTKDAIVNGSYTSSYTILNEAGYSTSDGILACSKDETGEKTNYLYGAQGRVEQVAKEGVVTTNFGFDGSNRIVRQEFSNSVVSELVTFTWKYHK